MKLMKQYSRVNSRAFSFASRCIDAWKSLNDDVVCASSMSMSMSIVVYTALNRKASNALCTLVKREKKRFQITIKSDLPLWPSG